MQQPIYYSAINDSIPLNATNWIASILRKHKGDRPEHAFLIIEGHNSFGQAIVRRYDLVINKQNEFKAQINIKERIVPAEDAQEVLLDDILRGDEVYAQSWSINPEQAKSLHNDALMDQENPPNYQISGNRSIIAKSTSQEGHSCFTWSREKLLNLKDNRMESIQSDIGDFIAAQTSRYIKGQAEPTSGKCFIM